MAVGTLAKGKNGFFSLMSRPLPPPSLMHGTAIKEKKNKNVFFAASLS